MSEKSTGMCFIWSGDNSAAAEDVLQETWMNALRGVSQFDSATLEVNSTASQSYIHIDQPIGPPVSDQQLHPTSMC